MLRFSNTLIAAGVAAVMAGSAIAATPVVQPAELFGGGATLPAIAYIGVSWLTYSPANRLSTTVPYSAAAGVNLTPADTNSLFGVFSAGKNAPNVSYCQTGSGGGRKVLDGVSSATGACTNYSTSPTGFGATVDANFAASDAPLAASEVSAFSTNRGAAHVAPVQFPAIAGAIAVVYNNADLGTTQLVLTESQVCQVFAGTITNWNTLNSALPSKPIVLVYRSDGSGTTFNFTNHLATVCPTAQPVGVSSTFSVNSTFASGDTAIGTSTVPGALFSSALPASGNGAVVSTTLATDGAIGYAEVADAKARASLAGGAGLKYAAIKQLPDVPAHTVVTSTTNPKTGKVTTKTTLVKAVTYHAFDPIKDLPKSIAVKATADSVLGANTSSGLATLVPQTPAGTAGCLQIVDPNSIAVPALKKGDYVQYPIIAVSYLMGFNKGNGSQTATTAALLSTPYSISSKVKTIGAGTGYAALTLTFGPGTPGYVAATGTTAAVSPKPASVVSACVLN